MIFSSYTERLFITPAATFVCRWFSWALIISLSFMLIACDPSDDSTRGSTSSSESLPLSPANSGPEESAWFVDVARQAGIHFLHFNGMSGEFYFPEIKGAGVGLFDFDNDGDLDVYLAQGRMLGPGKTIRDATFPPPEEILPLKDRLFRNDLTRGADGRPILKFVDVTEASGIVEDEFGLGVAAGDYDNDGWVDLYVTSFTSNRLWRNNGDGTFSDVTRTAGVEDGRYSTSAAFLDYDRDGWLDLYVVNYINFSYETHRPCYLPQGNIDYCGPQSYDAVPDSLFRNRGDGAFEDVSERARIVTAYGSGLGVVTADFDQDGWLDIYVANDNRPNFLWFNNGDGTFREGAMFGGCALSADGVPEASMGVDAGDFDNDGDEDLFMTHLMRQTNTLYINEGKGLFLDRTLVSGLGAPSQSATAFGTAWLDYDNDGWLDLFTANGAVSSIESLARAGDPFPYDEKNQLFRNLGAGLFSEVTDQAGADFQIAEVSRGAAFGDIDNDGDVDILVTNSTGPTRLLLNRIGARHHWLGVRLISPEGRDMEGAWAMLRQADAPPLWRRARAAASFCSTNDPRILFGLGQSRQSATLEVTWPDNTRERWGNLEVDQYVTLIKGRGEALKASELK